MRWIIVFLVFASNLFGWGEDITSIQANFTQITYQEDQTILYSGKLFAKNPHLAKWIYHTPIQKEIYLYANQVIIYEPLLEQATYTNIQHQADFFTIMTSATLGADGNYHAQIQSTLYTLILKDHQPHQIIYTDALNHKIEITLQEVQLNPQLSPSIFKFSPPKNIDIIQQ